MRVQARWIGNHPLFAWTKREKETSMKLFRTSVLATLCIALVTFGTGCAITDYRGYSEHQTQSEAKLFGSESASRTGDAALDGTYSYTVKYDFRGGAAAGYAHGIDINTYKNPVFAAFSRDGCIDRDGDNIQGRAGHLGRTCAPANPAGKFEKAYLFEDKKAGCQFFANLKQAFQPGPLVAVCFNSPQEEIDADLDLQRPGLEDFASLDQLVGQIWSGALGQDFTASVRSVGIDGVNHTLANGLTINVERNDMRPINATADFTTAGGRELLQLILANTQDGVPTSLSVQLDGGMGLSQPSVAHIAFDHAALENLLD